MICAALILTIVCPSADAQTAVKRPLSIKQAIQLALNENPLRRAASLSVSERRQEKDVARSALLPQATLIAAQGVKSFNMQNIIGGPNPTRIGPFQSIDVGPATSITLFNLPLLRRYQASREDVRTAVSQESATREQITAIVVARYFIALRATANREAAAARVQLAQRLYDQAAHLQKTGVGTEIDVLRAQVELQNEKQRLIDADAQHNSAIYALGQVLDLPVGQEPELTDVMEFYNLRAFSARDLIAEALQDRPEIRALDSAERAANLRTKAARDQRLPTLQISGAVDYQARKPDDGLGAYGYSIGLKVPLWTSGRIKAQEEEAKLEELKIAEQRREVESVVEQQVKTALDQLNAARQAVRVAELGLNLAHQEVERAQRRFEAGVGTNVEVTTAQDALARADDNRIEALYRFNQDRADLARSVGHVEDVYGK
ncbi:MAG TPA: TolC family protein [Bryobacteraceae bacterium]